MAEDKISESMLLELQASRELNKRIIEALPGGIVHVGIDGAIQTANAEALRILGMSYDELTGRYTQDFAPETIWENGEPCPVEDYPVTRALVTGEAQPPATIGVLNPNGEVSWAIFTAVPVKSSNDGETTGAVVTFLDVTANKTTMHALRDSEARLRSVVDSAPSTILTCSPEGTVLFINRSNDPNIPLESIVGASIFDFVDPEQVSIVRQCIDRVVSTGQIDGYELPGRQGIDDSIYSVRVGPIKDGDVVVALSFVATDITVIKQLQARVAVSDRLASIGTLAAGVAREINNPLTYLLLSLERAASVQVGDHAAVHSSLAAATDAARRIQKIVGDLAAFARSDADELQPVDLEEAIESALKLASTETRYRARLVRDYSPVGLVMADSARLSQVFLNLLVNAAQAIDEGEVEGNCITVKIRAHGGELGSVSITDTGGGIAPKMLPRIFEPFVTTKEVGEGTGLGLHICHNIVSSFEGRIDVESTLGEGTTFTVTLPIAKNVVPALAPKSTLNIMAPTGMRVLVIDDEHAIRQSLALLLSQHTVALAGSGREALGLLEAESYDAIFCDLIMPDMTGMQVHDFIVTRRPDLVPALVFMTGGAFTEGANSFLAHFEGPVLKKPFSLEEVTSVLAARA